MSDAPIVCLDLMRKPSGGSISAMSPDAIAKVRQLEVENLKRPQLKLATLETLHGGLYTRSLHLPAGKFSDGVVATTLLTGALIKIATTLIVQGDAMVFLGQRAIRVSGYQVITASAGRKQAFFAIEDTFVSMAFPTRATTVEEARREFTDEHELLAAGLPVTNITGE